MKKIKLGSSNLEVSNIALGCMRMGDKTVKEAAAIIKMALDCGINFFDHADMYAGGESEKVFAKAVKSLGINREDIIIQSKCAIDTKNKNYNFSKDYILESVDGILKRLDTDYIDVLLLHRPDALMEIDQVNEAFNVLYKEKKVGHFGVSNQSPIQMDLMKSGLDFPLLVNQVQYSLKHTAILDAGFNVNLYNDQAVDRGAGILEYAQLNKQTVQTWSPFFSGFFEEIFIDSKNFKELNIVLDEMAAKYKVAKEAIAVAWILRHPASLQVLVGSMTPERIKKISAASEINLSHNDWYNLYKAAGNQLP